MISNAQDMHFSQFHETSSLLNPAITGVTGSIRASLQYKDQWCSITAPYKTFGASYEMNIQKKKYKKGTQIKEFSKELSHNIAWGISFFSDKAGDGDMGLSQVNLSLSSRVPLNENNYVALGLQGGIAQRAIDFTKLVWPNQYNGSGYDQNINSGENTSSNNFIYGDFAAGLLWTYGKGEMYLTANNQIKANAGIALYHINRPRESFLSNPSETKNMRFVVHGGMLLGIKDSNTDIAPSFMINFQGHSKEIVIGTLFKHQFLENIKYAGNIKTAIISYGIYYRNKDAVIPAVLIEAGQYALGISYDVNVSDLHAVSSYQGGVEVILRFLGVNPFLSQNKPKK
jgi:type IX secretion system PorP/SprF family membrane protein